MANENIPSSASNILLQKCLIHLSLSISKLKISLSSPHVPSLNKLDEGEGRRNCLKPAPSSHNYDSNVRSSGPFQRHHRRNKRFAVEARRENRFPHYFTHEVGVTKLRSRARSRDELSHRWW